MQQRSRDGRKVYINNYPLGITASDLKRFMENIGPVEDVQMKTSFAFVTFQSQADALTCVALNPLKAFGRMLHVEACVDPNPAAERPGLSLVCVVDASLNRNRAR